jgi:hypothetical protein
VDHQRRSSVADLPRTHSITPRTLDDCLLRRKIIADEAETRPRRTGLQPGQAHPDIGDNTDARSTVYCTTSTAVTAFATIENTTTTVRQPDVVDDRRHGIAHRQRRAGERASHGRLRPERRSAWHLRSRSSERAATGRGCSRRRRCLRMLLDPFLFRPSSSGKFGFAAGQVQPATRCTRL